jgi:hypothetical protein
VVHPSRWWIQIPSWHPSGRFAYDAPGDYEIDRCYCLCVSDESRSLSGLFFFFERSSRMKMTMTTMKMFWLPGSNSSWFVLSNWHCVRQTKNLTQVTLLLPRYRERIVWKNFLEIGFFSRFKLSGLKEVSGDQHFFPYEIEDEQPSISPTIHHPRAFEVQLQRVFDMFEFQGPAHLLSWLHQQSPTVGSFAKDNIEQLVSVKICSSVCLV